MGNCSGEGVTWHVGQGKVQRAEGKMKRAVGVLWSALEDGQEAGSGAFAGFSFSRKGRKEETERKDRREETHPGHAESDEGIAGREEGGIMRCN